MFVRSLVFLAMFFCASSAFAADTTATQWVAGKDYVLIDPPQPTSTGDKIEVLEVFSYACPHCAHFQPYADKLKASLPKDAQFVLMPADFEPGWSLFSRAFYTAKALGLVAQTHQALFDALHRDHRPLQTLDQLADFYAEHGADKDTFLSTAQSFVIDGDLANAHRMEVAYGIDSTPTLVIGGKYRVVANSEQNIGFDQMVNIALYLVAQEETAKRTH